MDTSIEFTEEQFILFKKAYDDAVKLDHRIFIFDGKELLTGYAKYVVEYIEPKFKKK